MKKVLNGIAYRISEGNNKLRPSALVAFLIWNLPAVLTCPFRTPMCECACYARKAERVYPQVLPARLANLEASKHADFVLHMTQIIREYATKTRKKLVVVRIHESGDFYNKKYTDAWLQIARNCSDLEKVHFIAYTKSFVYFDGVTLPENFSLRASIWADTDAEQWERVIRNNWNIYTAVESFRETDTFHQCRCSDCAGCGKCWDNSVPDIRCEIH